MCWGTEPWGRGKALTRKASTHPPRALQEFYVRTSSAVYDIANVQDLFIHLTNYAVQKKKKKGKPERELEEDEMDEDDEQQEEGNNLSMEELNDFLLEEGYPMGCDGVMERIHEIIIRVFQSVWKKLDPLRERNTFEVLPRSAPAPGRSP